MIDIIFKDNDEEEDIEYEARRIVKQRRDAEAQRERMKKARARAALIELCKWA